MIHRQAFAALREHYAAGTLSPVAVAESALAHARAVDAELNAFALIDEGRALSAAAAAQARWRAGQQLSPIDGMPMTVKEFAAVAGWPTRRGSLTTSSAPAAASTVFVQRLEAAGAVLLGKTRAPEFNWKGVTDSPGFGITRNPWNPALTPGGSSGGCAAAVAAGVVRVSIGSDAGGSVRIPAAFCGVAGLKPSFGRIPVAPLPAAFFNIVHSGPIAAGIADLIDVYQVVAGPSAQDWTSTGLDTSFALPAVQGLRIGVLDAQRWQDSDAFVQAGLRQVAALLEGAGSALRSVDYDIRAASAPAELLYRFGCAAVVDALPEAERAKLDPGLVDFVQPARHAGLPGLLAALAQRDAAANRLNALFEDIDVLMLPTLPLLAFEAGRDVPRRHSAHGDWMGWNPYTAAFNGAQVPAISYPVWPPGSPLPVGVQFVAPKCREDRLLALAQWLEARLPIRTVGEAALTTEKAGP